MAALITLFQMAAERCGSTKLDGRHDASLCRGHRRAMILPVSFAVLAEDIRHFQFRAFHEPRRSEVLRRSGTRLNGNGVWEQVERTGGGADLTRGDSQVPGRGGQAAVSEQQLNGADIGSRFQQMNSEGVTHRMGSNRLTDARESPSLLARLFDGT